MRKIIHALRVGTETISFICLVSEELDRNPSGPIQRICRCHNVVSKHDIVTTCSSGRIWKWQQHYDELQHCQNVATLSRNEIWHCHNVVFRCAHADRVFIDNDSILWHYTTKTIYRAPKWRHYSLLTEQKKAMSHEELPESARLVEINEFILVLGKQLLLYGAIKYSVLSHVQ